MKKEDQHPEDLAREIEATQEKLESLEREIEEIGEPAAHELRRRLEALKVEEHALQRNFAEALAATAPDAEKTAKIQQLLHHIEREEASLEHAADFLHQSAPSTVELAARAGARVIEAGAQKLREALGSERHAWQSPLVNQTLEKLEKRYSDHEAE